MDPKAFLAMACLMAVGLRLHEQTVWPTAPDCGIEQPNLELRFTTKSQNQKLELERFHIPLGRFHKRGSEVSSRNDEGESRFLT